MGTTRCGWDAILFDFFGTLVDYEPDRVRLGYPRTHQLVCDWGYQGSDKVFVAEWDAASRQLEMLAARSFEEFTMLDAAAAFGAAAGLALPHDRCALLAATFVDEWQRHVRPITGVTELLAHLAARHRIGVVSNTHDADMVPAMLRAMGVAHLLDVIVLSVDHGYRKPHPSIYQVALAGLGCDPATVAFVGDSLDADYLGPLQAGMAAYLIDPGNRHDVPPAFRLGSVTDLAARLVG